MKKIISLALAAALTASLAGCASSDAGSTASSTAAAPSTAESTADSSTSSGDTIKIGVLTDRSSAAAATVTWAEAGAILALEEENEAGGLNGKQFELVYRDTASDSANVAQKATELVNEGCIAILGPKSDGEAPTGATWAEENKLRMNHWFFSTDLSFYVKGGRISKASGFVGTVLGICPLLNMDEEGHLIPRSKIRSKKRVIQEIVKRMEQ